MLQIGRNEHDPVVIKRRDSAFQDTELRVWLQSEGINLLVFAGIDTSICVETSLRDGFNIGYDVALISDATASGYEEHYKTTLERVRDYYGLVMSIERFKKAINTLDKIRKGEIDLLYLLSKMKGWMPFLRNLTYWILDVFSL